MNYIIKKRCSTDDHEVLIYIRVIGMPAAIVISELLCIWVLLMEISFCTESVQHSASSAINIEASVLVNLFRVTIQIFIYPCNEVGPALAPSSSGYR